MKGEPKAPAGKLSRRITLKTLAVIGAGTPLLGHTATTTLQPGSGAKPRGTPADPNLTDPEVPWPRTLDREALRTLAVLVDLILPGDERSPAASALGAHDFIDEWVSAPYPQQQRDRQVLLDGLAWLDGESQQRFGGGFAGLTPARQTAICDDVCDPARAAPGHASGAAFFKLVRDLTATAVWTTEEGMADLGYVGNVPLAKWQLPPPAVLKHLGLDIP